MTSTYTSNQGLEKPATGDRSGTWGTMTNTNMDILDRAISGVGALSLTGTTTTLTTSDGSASDGNYKVLVLGGSPSGTNTITLSPNDADKLYFVVNASGQSVIFSQGTGANVTVANGAADIIYADGAGSGAAVSSYLANDFVFKTGDGVILNLQTSDTTVTASSVLGRLNFTAPDEASGTDAILLAASIAAISEGTFAADNNATKLSFMTGASEAATEKMSISSVGNVTIKQTETGDDTPMTLLLQTGETDIAAADVLGKIEFQAPDEATGTDAILVAGAIDCVSEGDFSSSSNASKLSFRTGASETATEKMTISSAGDIAFTVSDGAAVTGVASINGGQIGGRRNYIYNGDMAICQRSTSVSVTVNGNAGLHVQDRWGIDEAGSPSVVFTMSQSTTTPDGFYSSLKLDCTTTSGTVGADDLVMLEQVFEGRDLQGWNKGDAQAKSVTLSFWVNTTKTGTYIVNFYDNDNSGRIISKSYTVSSSNTWEYKTITFEGDTTGAFDNDSAGSLYIYWGLVAGTNYTSGTLATSWASNVAANRFVGQVDAFDNTANNFHITGVQLELGDTASAFEYQSFGDNLAQCQRYFCRTYAYGTATGTATNNGSLASTSQAVSTYASAGTWRFPVEMRAAPTVTLYSTQNSDTTGKVTSDTTDGTGQATMISSTSVFINRADDSSGVGNNNYIKAHAIATADL